MCGIYGEYFPNTLLSKKEQFLKANDLNTSRGPDMSGYWTDSNSVQLGFRRLSIMDVSDNGNQPMVSKHQKYAMVFRMKTIQQFETEEICKELEITASNLWVIIHRARTQLRKCMEDNWFKN